MDIDEKKKINFRNFVNANNNFVFHNYKNKNGSNQWNIICSCMDWIDVAIRSFIHISQTPELNADIAVRTMQIYSLISSIDIVFEAIKQLHRIFVDKDTMPFSGDKECFKKRLFDKEDDNSYFKSIRASFGAHPVDIRQPGNKYFASWPNDFGEEMFVRLYREKNGEEDLVMPLSFGDLTSFLIKRYNYLDDIGKEISGLYNEYKKDFAAIPIMKKSDKLEQLNILKDQKFYGIHRL
tara:strand:- start:339 stop:1049 length:711 start_codon:yes stop_codon:yes gene_type:complete